MILSIFSSYPIPPRLIKISNLYEDDIEYISWNRKKYSITPNREITEEIFDDSKKGSLGQYIDVIKFRKLIKRKMEELNPDIIICRNWKTFFIVRLIRIKNARIIYDVCDVPNHTLIRFFEKILINRKIEVILASRFFTPFYKSNARVLENRISPMNVIKKIPGRKLRITYLGVVRYTDNLINLIRACDGNENLELYIYGYGDSLQAIRDFKEKNASRVILCGEYSEEDIPTIYSKTDVVWCAYPYKLPNVKIAISNKFFETIAFETPGIFSIKTKLGEMVENENIGFTVDPYSVEDIQKLVNSLCADCRLVEEKVQSIRICNEKAYWEDYKKEEQL